MSDPTTVQEFRARVKSDPEFAASVKARLSNGELSPTLEALVLQAAFEESDARDKKVTHAGLRNV
jgi:hypothetical protein